MLMSFAYPYMWLLALLIPAIFLLGRKKKATQTVAYPGLADATIRKSWRQRLLPILPLLQVLGLLTVIGCLARPQLHLVDQEITGKGIDIYLVLDVSTSMLAQDFKPDRLSASKQVAMDFVQGRIQDRIGLSIFAGESYTRCPATTDYELLSSMIADIQVGELADGTAIGMGLGNAVNRLRDSDAASKVIILLTDGENNAGYIEPLTAAQLAESQNIRVYTIGVGSQGRALMPTSRLANGRYGYSMGQVRIDEALLQDIAAMTGGQYFRARNLEELKDIYASIDEMEQSDIEVNVLKQTEDIYHRYLIFALMCFVLAWLLRHFIFKIIP